LRSLFNRKEKGTSPGKDQKTYAQCSFSRSDSTCDACEKRGRRCGGGKSAGDRRHLKADVDPIEGFRAVLRTLDQAMVQTVGSKQTVTLLKEVLASHNLDQDLEAGGIHPW